MHSGSHPDHRSFQSVVYVGNDGELPRRIHPLLAKHGVELLTAPRPDDPTVLEAEPRVLLLDTGVLRPDQTVQDLADSLKASGARAPSLVVVAHSNDIGLHLQALRADAAGFFVAPVASGELLEKLMQICRPNAAEAARVLVVEDSAVQGILAERTLKEAGFTVRILTDALKVLDVLDEFEPDLILMDLHMPRANGAELAAIIRQHEGFRLAPILYLSTESDQERQVEALSMGGDVFITKPIKPELLVRVVSQRIESMRTLRRHVGVADHRDPDTGLATRRHFLSRLERALAEPGSGEAGNGLLVVTLDGMGRIEEQLGYGGADLVQDRIGVMIRGQLGTNDLATRLDSNSHMLFIRRASADALPACAEDLRLLIAGYPIAVSGKTLTVTVSIGVAPMHPVAGDALALISQARKACAEAQRAGGNRALSLTMTTALRGQADEVHEDRVAGLLDRALGDRPGTGGFRILYQPLVAVNVDQRQYLAVLLELSECDGRAIPARDFLGVAKRTGRLVEIDRWLMLRALASLRDRAAAEPDLRFFVPQHMESLVSEGWAMWLHDRLAKARLHASPPILELAFHDVLSDVHMAPMLMKRLRKIGVEVCLTEVDQTPAAHDLVTDLQPRFVKLAATALNRRTSDGLGRLADRLRRGGAQIIATGVDYPDQIGPVWASGINYAQGALIQTPLREPVFDWNEVVPA
jgi:diguanylate cyclase (GGDEF)-like protein